MCGVCDASLSRAIQYRNTRSVVEPPLLYSLDDTNVFTEQIPNKPETNNVLLDKVLIYIVCTHEACAISYTPL